MKKNFFILTLILTLVMISTVVFAEEGIIVRIDSNALEFSAETGMPFIDINNRTQVPFRKTLESFGAEVEWNNETRTAIAKKGDITVEVPIDQNYILKNGVKVENDTVALIKDNITYLPIKKVLEAFGTEVQWDSYANTVVVTTEPIDARKTLMDAYAKSYKWENYDMNMLMNMSMPVPDDAGNIQEMDILMDMKMTAFMKPMKMMAKANMVMDLGGMKMNQPIMEMYYTMEDDIFTNYMGMYDMETAKLSWMKLAQENEMFSELMDTDSEKNMELNEKSIIAVKFLGNYIENEKILQKFENTTSFEAYEEVMGGYMNMLSSSGSQENLMAAEMLKDLEDITFVIYVDKATGEISRYEMDLSSLMSSIMGSMSGLMGEEEIPVEVIEMFKTLKMKMVMDVLNINTAKDFEIPAEALNAPLVEELVPAVTE